MNTVGGIIARFLEGHSPPEEGRLASIQDWGKSAFETFLSGFQMADFTILDTGLDLVKQRMETLLSSTENASQKIAAAMARVREAIAGPIAAARASGGPLDLS
ncbi:MAG: hypothetical protein GWN55_10470, partial [Phycisphaerae bacterium]|nr:hypothetical protein [Phycisphaerae bacterium]